MKANPGGQLRPDQVIGRDRLITSLWRSLERQSVVLSAERRLGKTSILRKMEASPNPGWVPIFRDFERVRTPIAFVEAVVQDAEVHLGRFKRTANRAKEMLRSLGPIEVGGILKLPPQAAPHWNTLLTRTIEDLFDAQLESRFVFFWDEVPLMLHNIKTDSGESVAMELLDTLRSLRQSIPAVRMVFTGSIGLHNVITSLRRAGYANAPINDMDSVDVPALDRDDAVALAVALLEGEGLIVRDMEATAYAVASHVDCLPFFVHSVVDQMVKRGIEPTASNAADVVTQSLSSPQDPWNLQYYRDRIDTYYISEERTIALALLDAIASAKEPQTLNQLIASLGTSPAVDKEQVIRTLTLVQRDHYVLQESSGAYRFRFPLIQRFWRLNRGIGG